MRYLVNFFEGGLGNDANVVVLGGTAPAPATTRTKSAAVPVASDGVLRGTTREVLNWVGDDLDRARRALDVERTFSEPRVTLTATLERMLDLTA